jgi:two-component system chemotaxis response regulator CheB
LPVHALERYAVAAIACSAGGVLALGRLLSDLPSTFPLPVLVVQHLDPRHQTMIATVLGRRCRLTVKLAEVKDEVLPGTVYVAPPNRHLLVGTGGRLELTDSELVHFVRPSADLLFESVAGEYGARAIACVLTGTGRDGAMGLEAVKSRGGTVIVQDPDTAQFNGMPQAAVDTGAVDFLLHLEQIAPMLCELAAVGRS